MLETLELPGYVTTHQQASSDSRFTQHLYSKFKPSGDPHYLKSSFLLDRKTVSNLIRSKSLLRIPFLFTQKRFWHVSVVDKGCQREQIVCLNARLRTIQPFSSPLHRMGFPRNPKATSDSTVSQFCFSSPNSLLVVQRTHNFQHVIKQSF